MQQSHTVIEFDSTIEADGTITVPGEILARARTEFGHKVRVRLLDRKEAAVLRERKIGDEEIESIARLQLESREQVVKFLMSEGALVGSKKRSRKGV